LDKLQKSGKYGCLDGLRLSRLLDFLHYLFRNNEGVRWQFSQQVEQLAVQLLKRWRDLAFEDQCLAPISVVLTTLAATYYQGEESVSDAVSTILAGIVNAITIADLNGERIVVRNPSNLLEDFGERWDANPNAYDAFKIGLRKLQKEWAIIAAGGRETNKELEQLFGEYVQTALVKRTQRLQEARTAGALAVGSTGGITGLGSSVTRIPQNVFHGDE
jgi:hypothetical protein